MYAPIRTLIRNNRIRDAFRAIEALHPRGEFNSRLLNLERRWKLIEDKALSQTEHESVLRIEENKVVEDLIFLLNRMEQSAQQPATPPPPSPTGTGDGGSKTNLVKYAAIIGAVLLIIAAVVFFRPQQEEPIVTTPEEAATEVAQEVDKATDAAVPANPAPAPPPVEESVEEPPAAQRTPADKITDLKVDFSKISNRPVLEAAKTRLQLDPAASTKLLVNALAYMTDGEQVDVAVAAYTKNTGSSDAEYNERMSGYLTKSISIYHGRKFTFSSDVLTPVFHASELPYQLAFSRWKDTDSRLKSGRARYLLIVDVRQKSSGQADFRTALYDVEAGKLSTHGTGVQIDLDGRVSQQLSVNKEFGEHVNHYVKRGYLLP